MLHVRGHTPEGDAPLVPCSKCFDVSAKDVLEVWTEFNSAPEAVDLIAIGSPHASMSECREFSWQLEALGEPIATKTIITVGRSVLHKAQQEGLIDRLNALGVTIIPDLCWCSITTPVFPTKTQVLMTNSGKYAHYAKGLTGCDVRFGSLRDCAEASVNGRARSEPPDWLTRKQ
jgi:predicted aconitase